LQFLLYTVGAGLVGLVDHEDVGDLHDPGLDRLDVVTHPGDQHHHRYLRQVRDLDFVLPHSHRLDQHVVPAGHIHQPREIGGGAGQAAGGAAGGHRPDEDAGIGVVLLHADAVAQNRAAGDAARRVHRDDRESLALAAQFARQRVHQRTLTGAGRTGDSHDAGVPGEGRKLAQDFQRLGIAVLHTRGGAGKQARVAFSNFTGPIVHQLFRSCLAMTRRWISLVPSPMVQSFTSR
jgi:hypothetical protein